MKSDRNQPIRRLGEIVRGRSGGESTDGQLLDLFATSGETAESAFRTLMERHGGMVLRVCRRALGSYHDAEDAFQATFLILLQKAGAIRRRDSIAAWLHGVALRVAADARAAARRRADWQVAVSEEKGARSFEPDSADLTQVVLEEVGRLPEKYRATLVLCHLEGLTHEAAARQLRCPVGTIRSRLARARDFLRPRLVRRGLAPAAVLAMLAEPFSAEAIPPDLIERTIAATAGAIPIGAGKLVREECRRMVYYKIKTAGLVFGIVAAGALALAAVDPDTVEPPKPVAEVPLPANEPAPLPTKAEVRDALRFWREGMETLQFRERVTYLGPDGVAKKTWPTGVVDYAHAPGNRRVVRHGSINPAGAETLIQERRFDGTTQTYIGGDGKFPPKITWVEVFNQTDPRDHYEGEHGYATRLLMYFGPVAARPLHAYLDEGAKLDITRGPDSKPRVVLHLASRWGEDILYDLDPDHGFLPCRIEGPGGTVVTKFDKENGVWFPIAGYGKSKPDGSRENFAVVDLKINRPVPDSHFTLPPDLKDRVDIRPSKLAAFGPDTLANAAKSPNDPKTILALMAMIEDRDTPSGAIRKAMDLMLQDHVNDPAILRATRAVSNRMTSYGDDYPEQFLRAVVKKTANKESKVRASLNLAQFLRHRAEHGLQVHWVDDRLKTIDYKGPSGGLGGPSYDEAKAGKMLEECRRLLEQVLAEAAASSLPAAEARDELKEIAVFGLGKVAPEIAGTDIDGRPMKLSDYRGQVVLLVFWGDWCPFCRSEYDSEREVVTATAGKPFALLGVNSDRDPVALRELIGSKNLPGRSWWDGGPTGPIAKAWKVDGWPVIYVLDGQGRIRIKGVRGLHMRRAVDALLAENAAK